MSGHPVTPMREADLRLHLAGQTQMKVGLVDVPVLGSGMASEAVASLLAAGHQAVLFDTIDVQTQGTVGALVWSLAQQAPLFSASSSGLTAALISAWNTLNIVTERTVCESASAAKPLLILSGSCSAVTERQIRYALAHGYQGISLDPAALLDSANPTRGESSKLPCDRWPAGRDTVFYTTLGAPSATVQGDQLGVALGDCSAGHSRPELCLHDRGSARVGLWW